MSSRKRGSRFVKEKVSEADMAAEIVMKLKSTGWEVYQEVVIKGVNGPADIVAVRNGKIWVIETKLSINLDLIGQAHRWLGLAHWVTMAVPYPKRGDLDKKSVVNEICKDYGISLMYVDRSKRIHHRYQGPPAPLPDCNVELFANQLCEEQKDYAPAGGRGSVWTPYKTTCKMILKHVTDNPGCTVKDLVEAVGNMHYSTKASARTTILKRVCDSAVPGVEIQNYGKDSFLFPVPIVEKLCADL